MNVLVFSLRGSDLFHLAIRKGGVLGGWGWEVKDELWGEGLSGIFDIVLMKSAWDKYLLD